MAKGSFTLMVISAHDVPVRSFHVRARVFVWAAIAVTAFVTTASVASSHYASIVDVAAENQPLRHENAALRAELDAVSGKLESIGGTLDRVQRFDQKLRTSTVSEAGFKNLAMGPTQALADTRRVDPDEVTGARVVVEDLPAEAERLSTEAMRRENSLQQLQAYFQDQKSLLAATPSIWPIRGVVTSDFGGRADPFSMESAIHSGIDIAAPTGKEVVAPSDGTVVFAGLEGGYGNVLVIDHGYGLKTRYGHLSHIQVIQGARVKRGDRIANIGSTGKSTGPHLHYEVRVDGHPRNPRAYILEDLE